jgi:hypothetical protein
MTGTHITLFQRFFFFFSTAKKRSKKVPPRNTESKNQLIFAVRQLTDALLKK